MQMQLISRTILVLRGGMLFRVSKDGLIPRADAQTNDLNTKAGKQQAEAQQIAVETQLKPQEVQAKLAAAISTNLAAGTEDDKEFERRAKLSELMFKEKELDLKEKDMLQKLDIVKMQMEKPLTME